MELETKHAIIVYEDEKELEALNDRLKYYPGFHITWQERLKHKVDECFERVVDILKLDKELTLDGDFPKVKIDPNSHRNAYYHSSCLIKLSDDTNIHILAHEFGHFLLRTYGIKLPHTISEIVCKWVDTHLA